MNGPTNYYPLWIEHLKDRMNTDWDNVIIIQGERGSGKSTLGLRIALDLDPKFELEKRCFFRLYDWRKHFDVNARQQVYLFDEGTNIAFSRTFWGPEQVALMQLLNVIRQRNHTLIWCAPNSERLDNILRSDIAKYRISVERRGTAVIQEKFWSWRMGKAWWEEMLYPLDFVPLNGTIWPRYEAMKFDALARQTETKARDKPRSLSAVEWLKENPKRTKKEAQKKFQVSIRTIDKMIVKTRATATESVQ